MGLISCGICSLNSQAIFAKYIVYKSVYYILARICIRSVPWEVPDVASSSKETYPQYGAEQSTLFGTHMLLTKEVLKSQMKNIRKFIKKKRFLFIFFVKEQRQKKKPQCLLWDVYWYQCRAVGELAGAGFVFITVEKVDKGRFCY